GHRIFNAAQEKSVAASAFYTFLCCKQLQYRILSSSSRYIVYVRIISTPYSQVKLLGFFSLCQVLVDCTFREACRNKTIDPDIGMTYSRLTVGMGEETKPSLNINT
ncbi:MAG: hypothetical protein KAR32_09230, partial [Candidatus Omnitrophica bacterium]|nr:hypothetical protein [Candidatus Omnitrophota bacterium]